MPKSTNTTSSADTSEASAGNDQTPEQLAAAAAAAKAEADKADAAAAAAAAAAKEAADAEEAITGNAQLANLKRTIAGKPVAELLPVREEIARYVRELGAREHLRSFHDGGRLERHRAELGYLDHLLK